MLLLQDAEEVVLEFLAPYIAGAGYRDASAISRGSVLLDVVLDVVVVDVV
jgi:hypothetical protein